MNVEQPPAPRTESLFKFSLHFTGLNTDRGSDLQCKRAHKPFAAVLALVLACHVYPVWVQVDVTVERGVQGGGHRTERQVTILLQL